MTDETLQREIAGTMLPNDEFALAYPESVPDTCEMDAAVLIEAVVECLWRLYGYEPGIDGRHPETERVFRLDAVSLIEGIERAGYRIVAPGTVVLRYADSEVLLPGFDPDNAAPEDKL